MLTKRDLLRSAAAMAALTATVMKPGSVFAQDKAEWPSLLEAKDIAEEGFIYGLPLVMNYAVMQEFAVDRNSGQFKAPFNEINSMHQVASPEDTAVITPNSDTPYSILWLDLRAEPMVVSVPAVEKDRYYSVQLIDGNTYNFGYIGSRATRTQPGDYLVVGPDWKGEKPNGIKQVSDRPHRSYSPTSARSSSTPTTCRTAPEIAFLPATTAGSRPTSSNISTLPCYLFR